MSWWGKVVGGTFGFLMGGPLGALLGAALGHNLDRGYQRLQQEETGFGWGDQQRVQTVFFTASFSVMGHVAKADGRVSEDEIQMARVVMAQMSLTEQMRGTAIRLFNEGKHHDFPLVEVLDQFRQECRGRRNLMRMFIEIQLMAAYADGVLHPSEAALIRRICQHIGFPQAELQHLEQLVRLQQRFTHAGPGGARQRAPSPQRPSLGDAYAVLGVEQGATDAEVKKAYRRLISQHHPDKLVAKGLPDEMMRMATQKTHEIKQAYEQVREARGMR